MNSLEQLLGFLILLQNYKIQFRLDCVRDAIMVIVPCPGKYYEIEFFADGRIEVQMFGPRSDVATMTIEEITLAMINEVNG